MAQKKNKRKKTIVRTLPLSPQKYIELKKNSNPIHECFLTPQIEDHGLGHALISRMKANGDLVAAVFMVDVYCLGVKDAFYNIFDPIAYEEFKEAMDDELELEKVDPGKLHSLIYGSLDYGKANGFSPPKDFKVASMLLDPRGTYPPEQIEFGKNGQPFYIAGPFDDPQKIFKTLEKTLGIDNFTFVLDPEALDSDEFDSEEEEELFNAALRNLPKGALEYYNLMLNVSDYLAEIYSEKLKKLKKEYIKDRETLFDRHTAKMYDFVFGKSKDNIDSISIEFIQDLMFTCIELVVVYDFDFLRSIKYLEILQVAFTDEENPAVAIFIVNGLKKREAISHMVISRLIELEESGFDMNKLNTNDESFEKSFENMDEVHENLFQFAAEYLTEFGGISEEEIQFYMKQL